MSRISKWTGIHASPKGIRIGGSPLLNTVTGGLYPKDYDTTLFKYQKENGGGNGSFGADLAQGGFMGVLNYILSTGDRKKRKELDRMLMEQMRRQSEMQGLTNDFTKQYMGATSPLIQPLTNVLKRRLADRPTPPDFTKIKPFGPGYSGPLTARL